MYDLKKMKHLTSFTHLNAIPNMYDLLSSAEQKEDLEKCLKCFQGSQVKKINGVQCCLKKE